MTTSPDSNPSQALSSRSRSPWPIKLAFRKSSRTLYAAFDDGAEFEIPYELLRIESPSAEVQGHSAGEKRLMLGKARVDVTAAELVGRYAVRIKFDDGHNSGLFTWDWLYRLGRDRDQLMAAYYAAVSARSSTLSGTTTD